MSLKGKEVKEKVDKFVEDMANLGVNVVLTTGVFNKVYTLINIQNRKYVVLTSGDPENDAEEPMNYPHEIENNIPSYTG